MLSGPTRATFDQVDAVLNVGGVGWHHFMYAEVQPLQSAIRHLAQAKTHDEKEAAKTEILRIANE